MSGFSAQWLTLREPADATARAASLCAALTEARVRRVVTGTRTIVDLGSGTGANLRYVAPILGGTQDWLLLDNDTALGSQVEQRMRTWTGANSASWSMESRGELLLIKGPDFTCRVQHQALDLATRLDSVPLSETTLVTASALLDLVSENWLGNLVGRAAAAGAMLWFTLTYDGRIQCHPAEPEDAEVRDLFNRHQRTDKGFGPALGPEAGRVTCDILQRCGYVVSCASSDWCLGPEHKTLQHAMVQGWFDAACEWAPQRRAALAHWLARRQAHIDDAQSKLRVGHIDILARLPPIP